MFINSFHYKIHPSNSYFYRYACWRMSVMIHEIGHAIHYIETEIEEGKPLPRIDDHGQCWEKILKDIAVRGNLKNCAFLESSPRPKCLFKGDCLYCLAEELRMSTDAQQLYATPEVDLFDGVCKICKDDFSKPVSHLLKSEQCLRWYQQNFGGEMWKFKVKRAHAKNRRRAKRTTLCKSVCSYCDDSKDWNLPMHLQYNKECANQYMTNKQVNTVKDLLLKIKRERKNQNQKDCRARKKMR